MHFLDLVEMRVVKEGIGTWSEVQAMPVQAAMDAFYYLVFLGVYQETEYELSKEQTK